jgi:hypothetical protein
LLTVAQGSIKNVYSTQRGAPNRGLNSPHRKGGRAIMQIYSIRTLH